MDFSTIQKKMERKDGTCYTNVREICSDVRLIFANAMKYNDDQNVIHLMAKSLLEKFEEKWLHFLPKVESEVKFFSHACSSICFFGFEMYMSVYFLANKSMSEPFICALYFSQRILVGKKTKGRGIKGCCSHKYFSRSCNRKISKRH